MITPWDDGIITEDEFTMMLDVSELKQMFMQLPEEEQHEILKRSGPEKAEVAETLDKLAKYLKSSWFRGIALKRAAEFGLNEEEADHFARVWKHDS